MTTTTHTPSYVLADSATMLRRNIRHLQRYPSLTGFLIGIPVVFLLLFVYVFGGTLGAGLGGAVHGTGRGAYANYLAPAIILLTIAAAAPTTAISAAMDMQQGIITRFRTMNISRSSVLAGHVLGSLIQTMIAVVVVIGFALLVGFRPQADLLSCAGALGLVLLVAFSIAWLSVALGLGAKSVETASNSPTILLLLPFLGSGFVPAQSMPTGLRWFAEYQPFTPINEALRGLLMGGPVAEHALISVAWCAGLTVLGFVRARKLFNRDLVR